MRWSTLGRLSRVEKAIVVACVGILIAIALPDRWPHWTEMSSESCHICGNIRCTVKRFRWYRMTQFSQTIPTDYPFPSTHEHEWWRYDWNYVSRFTREGGSRDTYRDSRMFLGPPETAGEGDRQRMLEYSKRRLGAD
jgi:hypothetical protein